MKNIIVWFRRDLRIHDNPALSEASQAGNVIPLFIWSEDEEQDYQSSAASLWWLHHSLIALKQKLKEKGLKLVLRSGHSQSVLEELIAETGAEAIYYNERYEPTIRQRDEAIKNTLSASNLDVRSFHSHLLFPPYDIQNQKNEPYKIFTSYYKRVLLTSVPPPAPYPLSDKGFKADVQSLNINDLNLLPQVRWDKKFHSYWEPGEEGAIKQFEAFAAGGLSHYEDGRNIPSEDGVSLLSPYLVWGNISVRAIWHSLDRKQAMQSLLENNLVAFKRQLIWRDFAYHQLIYYPKIATEPLRAGFKKFPWLANDEAFSKWKQGLTGYPLVDAGMRELRETGIIHNRVRMVVASFLVKHLLVSWTRGYSYFSETLVDFDVANNALGWQWITGCGIETAPYFRIFNPILQSQKFDQDGDYIRKWVPELAGLSSKHIHEPWKAPEEVLQSAQIELGKTYPLPIVDHPFARKRALAAFEQIKKK